MQNRRPLGALCSAGKDSQEGRCTTDESSQVREDRGHGEHDVPQRGVCAAQSAISLLQRIYLRQFTVCCISFIYKTIKKTVQVATYSTDLFFANLSFIIYGQN